MVNGIIVDKVIFGVVYGDGEFLIGVIIVVKGIVKGIIIDIDGKFELLGIFEDVEVLVIFYMGYIFLEMEIGIIIFFEIILLVSNIVLDEVVVIFFGIEWVKKVLGYVVQDVDVVELVEVRFINVVNSLLGCVVGV